MLNSCVFIYVVVLVSRSFNGNSDLENFEQTVVQFSMTHTKSNQTAIDMMAVNCGGDCFSYYEELNG